MPGRKRLAGALAVAATALAISACGSSNTDATIEPDDADTLQSALTAVQTAIDQGHCEVAQAEANNFVVAVNELPETVGTDNKEALRAAGENLEELAGDKSQCKPPPDTGATGEADVEPTTTAPTVTTPTETTTTTSTTSTAPEPPSDEGEGNEPPSDTGGGPPSDTGGGPPSDTGGGGDTGGAGGSGGGTGSGGVGSGGTG
jgi:hypothetical protein